MTSRAELARKGGAATEERLWELHRLVLDAMLDHFTHTPREALRPAWIAVAARFLFDNGVTLDMTEIGDIRRSLSEMSALSVPFPTKTKQ